MEARFIDQLQEAGVSGATHVASLSRVEVENNGDNREVTSVSFCFQLLNQVRWDFNQGLFGQVDYSAYRLSFHPYGTQKEPWGKWFIAWHDQRWEKRNTMEIEPSAAVHIMRTLKGCHETNDKYWERNREVSYRSLVE